jgi:hypothetical protein
MKFLLLILFFVTIFFFEHSHEQTTMEPELATTESEIETTEPEIPTTESGIATDEPEIVDTTTTPWWTRTFPIITTRTRPPRPVAPLRTTTSPNRVSNAVSIAVPITLFALTFIVGYGLIAYAIRTGGSPMPFLTRTNDPLTP